MVYNLLSLLSLSRSPWCVDAGDEREGAWDEHGGPEGHVFPLLPFRALLEGFRASSGEPEERAFDGVHGRYGSGTEHRGLRFLVATGHYVNGRGGISIFDFENFAGLDGQP